MDVRLTQIRAATERAIEANTTIIVPLRPALVDNGFGTLVPSGPLSPLPRARVRITASSSLPPASIDTQAGIGPDAQLYVVTDYRAPLEDNDQFDALGDHWTVGHVDLIRYLGQVYATRARISRRG